MGNKNLTGNIFSKGKSGNPYGRPKLTEAQKQLQLKTRAQFNEMIQKYMVCEFYDLEKLSKRKDLPAIDAMIIKSLLNAIKSGNQSEINWFMDHTVGKPKQVTNINLTGSMEHTKKIDYENLSKEELISLKGISEKLHGKAD